MKNHILGTLYGMQSAMRWECLQNCGVENVAWNITVKSQIF